MQMQLKLELKTKRKRRAYISSYWRRGELAQMAIILNVALPNLSAVLHKRMGVSIDRAKELQKAALAVGHDVHWMHWADRDSKHPAFVFHEAPGPKA